MNKFELYLDESGSFSNKNENYFILGGLIFNTKDKDHIESILLPLNKHLCSVYHLNELHASEKKKIYANVAPILGSISEMLPILFVVDKKVTWVFDRYDDLSFIYNKAIEYLCKELIKREIIKKDDSIDITIDYISVKPENEHNLEHYLSNCFDYINSLKRDNSQNNIFLQYADIIANSASKNKKMSINTEQFNLLKPELMYFLDSTKDIYVDNG